jgi:prepilin-type N-terminal cleavage/methylation domain-containing protein
LSVNPRGEEKNLKDRHLHRLRRLRSLRRNNQRGFTLIELLVVISILGILAAVVTMSMVGVTQLAQRRAASAELKTVQLAVDTMANEQQVPEGNICNHNAPAGTTNDMQAFPSSDSSAGIQPTDPPTGHAVALFPRYLRQQTTYGSYTCSNGVVTQTGYSPP